MDAINCFHVFWTQLKVKHLEGRNNHINLSQMELASPWGLEDFPAGWKQEEGTGKTCLSSASRRTTWAPLLSSHLSFPHLLLLCPPHKHYSTSVPYLSEWITCDRKQTKICFFQLTLCFRHSWLDTEPELTLDWLPLLNTPEGWQRSAEAVWEGNAPLKSCSEICYETCSLSMSKSNETYTSMP